MSRSATASASTAASLLTTARTGRPVAWCLTWATGPSGGGIQRSLHCRAALAPRVDAGDGALGRRSFNGVADGTFAGARLKVTLAPRAGDWMLTRRDGNNVVDARAMLVTEDGAAIYMTYGGRIVIPPEVLAQARDPERRGALDPASCHFRTAPVFETGAADYAWLNDVVAVGVGRLLEEGVGYDVFQVL